MRTCLKWLCVSFLSCLLGQTALGEIDLEWRPHKQSVGVGDTVDISLYAISDSDKDQLLAAVRVIVKWDSSVLRLIGVDDTGAPEWAFSGFPLDAFYINEEVPPQDGNGLYEGWGSLGKTVTATPEGTLMTTFQFEALKVIPRTKLSIRKKLRIQPNPKGHTKVYDGTIPNKDVTGKLSCPARILIKGGSPGERYDQCPSDLCMARYAYPPDGQCAEPMAGCLEGHYCYCVEIQGTLPGVSYTFTCEGEDDQELTTDKTGNAIACWDIGDFPYLLMMGVEECDPPSDRLMCGLCYCIELWQGECWDY